MSQIATGYGVTSSLLNQLMPTLEGSDHEAFWSLLHDHAAETTPAYSFSGSVVTVAVEYLEDRGLSLPLNDSHAVVRAILSSGLSLAMCCQAAEAGALVAAMRQLQPDDEELGRYFAEFTGEVWDQASDALREGLDYIARTLLLAPARRGDWILLFIG